MDSQFQMNTPFKWTMSFNKYFVSVMTGCLSVLAFLCQGVCEVFYAKKKQIVIALSSILVLQ